MVDNFNYELLIPIMTQLLIVFPFDYLIIKKQL